MWAIVSLRRERRICFELSARDFDERRGRFETCPYADEIAYFPLNAA
jgi:hypothetical protein